MLTVPFLKTGRVKRPHNDPQLYFTQDPLYFGWSHS